MRKRIKKNLDSRAMVGMAVILSGFLTMALAFTISGSSLQGSLPAPQLKNSGDVLKPDSKDLKASADENITRGELARLLVLTKGVDVAKVNCENRVPDLASSNQDICYWLNQNIMVVQTDGLFHPEGHLKRNEAAKIFAIAFLFGQINGGNADLYSDVKNSGSGDAFADYINTLATKNILDVAPGMKPLNAFNPEQTLSRASAQRWATNLKLQGLNR